MSMVGIWEYQCFLKDLDQTQLLHLYTMMLQCEIGNSDKVYVDRLLRFFVFLFVFPLFCLKNLREQARISPRILQIHFNMYLPRVFLNTGRKYAQYISLNVNPSLLRRSFNSFSKEVVLGLQMLQINVQSKNLNLL